MPHEKFNQRAVVVIQAHASRDRLDHIRADFGMAPAKTLADVVKHQAEIEQLDGLQFARKLRQQRRAFGVFTGPQPLDFLDQAQRMLIDGVNVIGVVQHHAQQPAEFRNERAQHSSPMHLEQRLVNRILPFEDAEERQIGRRRAAKFVIDQFEILAQQLARFMR